MNCYFCQSIPGPPLRVALDEFESRHAATSRRQQVGDRILLIDGEGGRAVAAIETISRSLVEVCVEARCRIERPKPEIVLGSALPKGERQKVMLDMMTQLGVCEFVPLECERSVARPNDTSPRRWARICRQACKQSQNPYLPGIAAPEFPLDFVRKYCRLGIPVYVADQTGEPFSPTDPLDAAAICVGPEGGFTTKEKEQMIGAGVRVWSLGSNVLRIETAVVAAVSSIASHGSSTAGDCL